MNSASLPVPRARARRRAGPTRALFAAGIGVLLLVVVFPFLWLLQMSFRPEIEMFSSSLLVVPTLDNYLALRAGQFPRSFWNSTVASVASTAISLLLGVPAAYALSRARFRAERQIELWILASRMAPPIAFTIPFFLAYRYLDMLDTVQGLVVIYLTFNLSLVIWMMRIFFDSVPRALEEAAWIDGGGVWGSFLRVILPLSAPGLAATAIFCFLFSWNDFFYALILTRTQAMTAPVAVVNFMQYQGWEWGKIAAAGTLVMLPVVIFSLIVRNYLVNGLTAGAVKG
jgi:multiple sugar transport system permease protein